MELTARQEVAVTALARGDDISAAAKAADVSRRTVLRWRCRPDFSDAVVAVRAASFEQALAAIQSGFAEAVAECRRQMKATKGSPHRLAAARALLACGLRAHEQLDLEVRLRLVEGAVRPDLRVMS